MVAWHCVLLRKYGTNLAIDLIMRKKIDIDSAKVVNDDYDDEEKTSVGHLTTWEHVQNRACVP